MNCTIIKPGQNFIWDMEIDAYKEAYLSDFFDDTVIDFEHLYCEEMYVDLRDLRRKDASTWMITVPINHFVDIAMLEMACKDLYAHCSFLIRYYISPQQHDNHEITILLDKDMSVYEAFYCALARRDEVIDYAASLQNKRLASNVRTLFADRTPIYFRAMKKVELELSNFTTDDVSNGHKIINISSRVKTVDSIEEKVYRKNICQFDLFERFDDIAGVRCTCEFLSDVYDVLEYIRHNPLLNVQSIEDKISTPSEEGYRGIHIIATTDVYYHNSLYENVKVEIQLRTAFQNAWSMKTHQLTYKQDTISPEISSTLRMMSDALKDADNAAQRIRDTLRSS